MTTLVTGATGFVGWHVTRLLSDQGHKPRMMFRRPGRARILADLDGEQVIADLGSEPSLRRAAAGVNAVIHLAGRATFEPYGVIAPTLVEGTRSIARAAADAGAEVFVFASSTFVYPSVEDPIDEDTPTGPRLGYGRAKLEAEQLLERVAQSTGMRVICIRLPHVYGARSIMFDFVRRGFVPFAGDMDAIFSHLHVEDAARALVRAVDTAPSGPLQLSDLNSVQWRDFFSVLHVYQPDLRVFDLPARPIERLLRAIEPLRRHRSPSMVTPDTVRGWRLNQPVDATSTWERLELEPLHETIETGIPASLEASIPAEWRHSLADRRR